MHLQAAIATKPMQRNTASNGFVFQGASTFPKVFKARSFRMTTACGATFQHFFQAALNRSFCCRVFWFLCNIKYISIASRSSLFCMGWLAGDLYWVGDLHVAGGDLVPVGCEVCLCVGGDIACSRKAVADWSA
jgi:hypothetical protein